MSSTEANGLDIWEMRSEEYKRERMEEERRVRGGVRRMRGDSTSSSSALMGLHAEGEGVLAADGDAAVVVEAEGREGGGVEEEKDMGLFNSDLGTWRHEGAEKGEGANRFRFQ